MRLTIILFLLISLLAPVPNTESSSRDASQDIYKIIMKMEPNMNKEAAMRIAKATFKIARQNNAISWQTTLAVAHKESSFDATQVSPTGDIGLMQFSPTTIKLRELDKTRLVQDESYAIKCGVDLLAYNKKHYGKRYKNWIGIYNAGTNFANPRIRQKHIIYTQGVMKRVKLISALSKEVQKERSF